ncbi:hypothetical protein ACFY93_13520 [Streptomyces sp. NPDC008313]|uniref:hypothetical protein n=1 Tax=Streptomyces sp. NPDC008313 TaxID=3364826 RepID=UPI0036F0E46D
MSVRFLGLLDDGDDLTSRKPLPGHVTAGAILVGLDGRILHDLHNAIKWPSSRTPIRTPLPHSESFQGGLF